MDTTAQLPFEAVNNTVASTPEADAEPQPAEGEAAATSTEAAPAEATPLAAAGEAEAPVETRGEEPAPTLSERQRIEEQLQTLKRREAELRRALAIADHPALADAIRELEGRVYAVARAEDKLAQGLSKAEERRRETLERKVAGLREKRAELDTQIGALDTELAGLGVERTRGFEHERDTALEQLFVAMGTHGGAIEGAGLEASQLVPELERFLPKVQELAHRLSSVQA
jgi:chromosome segregation ATPase